MERVAPSLRGKIMSADEAAQFIKSGMTLGMSGFTIVGYPKAVPAALVKSGHARDLTVCIGASVGDELDGAMVRAGLVKRRFSYQSNKDMRAGHKRRDGGLCRHARVPVSRSFINQGTGPEIDLAVVEPPP
jgi:succinyl-CoA:acetate CoA-transferase